MVFFNCEIHADLATRRVLQDKFIASNGTASNGLARLSFERASGKQDLPEADRNLNARRPRYLFSSCVPEELDSVSSGYRSIFDQRLNRKIFRHLAMP